ncbi:MAG: DsrE family protein [Thermodesulfovibrionales bacterium]|nr:DsrE family protein [Thermodesulfovibrionales bacterium]
MITLSIILRKPPYGSVEASEAVRHALGGITEDMSVNLLLIDGGVNAARKGQDIVGTDYLNIEEGLKDCIELGVKVYIEKGSLKVEDLELSRLISGVNIITNSELSEILANSDVTMIF